MRAINEGAMTEGTLLRTLDPLLLAMNTSGAQVELGAGVTMAMVLASRDLSYLHARRAASAAPRCGPRRPSAAICSPHALWRLHHRAAGARRCRHAACRFRRRAGDAARGDAGEPGAGRGGAGRLGWLQPPGRRRCVSFRQGRARAAQGRLGAVDRGASAAECRTDQRRADRLWRDGAGAAARQGGRARAGGPSLDAATIAAAKTAALEGTQPATDAIASEWYRREVLPVHLGRLFPARHPEGTQNGPDACTVSPQRL